MSASLRRALLGALLLTAACEEKPKDAVPTPPAPYPLETVDASALGEGALATDPPAPAGDLKTELERFVNLDTCVSERAKLDPLIGDAIGAIGYDTLLRDACRLLEAAKDKKREPCDKIDSTPLRQQCVSWVAMVSQTADACPLQYEAMPSRGRSPACVAVAARDFRLCAGEPRAAARATCEALVLRDAKRCDGLLPNARASCVRELTRWQNVLSAPLEGLEKLPATHAKLTTALADAGADAGADIDLGELASRGVVVVTARERIRVELGSLIESDLNRIAAIPQKRPRFAVALLAETATKRATIQKLELVLPGDAPFVSPPAPCDCKVTRWSGEAKRGAPVDVRIEGTIGNGTRQQPVAIDVATWVRDVATDAAFPSPRALPALQPLGARDGG